MLTVDAHPLLDLRALVTLFPGAMGTLVSSPEVFGLLSLDAAAPLDSSDEIRSAVRGLLRYGGFKPTGRSKPASEYLIRAASQGTLGSINVAADVCNAVSLHSGLPISVIDLDLAHGPFRVGIASEGDSYVFNQAGQTMDVGGLLCLFDAVGPCANPVKDSQRTKTHQATRRTLSLIWGSIQLAGRAAETDRWYQELLKSHGGVIQPAPIGWK